MALALRISIRSTDSIPNDLLAIKSQLLAAPAPAWTITKVTAETSPTSQVAAIVEGTWQAPDWRSNGFFVRDAAGVPIRQATRSVPFILALPKAALSHPVPITMYQHGNPGSSEREVPSHARKTLAGAGFAVVGFTDPLNREVAPAESDPVAKMTAQVYAIFLPLTQFQRMPDYWVETNAEQLAFVRMLSTLGSLDVLPVGAPDGVPDLDPTLPLTYVGISEGANHGPGLLPYAPEIKAAALVAGGRRFTEVLIHQQAQVILSQLGGFFQNAHAGRDLGRALAVPGHVRRAGRAQSRALPLPRSRSRSPAPHAGPACSWWRGSTIRWCRIMPPTPWPGRSDACRIWRRCSERFRSSRR